ncbi:MAG: efflux transporter outer membrane subunit [Candidatus Melainabacteria bacterium]
MKSVTLRQTLYRTLAGSFFLLHAAAGCLPVFADAPDHTQPVRAQVWQSQSALQDLGMAVSESFPLSHWWETFEDPTLNAWVTQALENNPELAVLEERVNEARSMANLARAPLFPSLSVGASYAWQQYSRNQFLFPIQQRTFHVFNMPIKAGYELDLFGKNIQAWRAEKSRYHATELSALAARSTLAATVVSAYWNLLLADSQLSEQETLVTLSADQLTHAQALFDAGQIAGDQLDTSKQLAAQQHAEMARLKANQVIAAQTLVLLAGGNPSLPGEPQRGNLKDAVMPEHFPVGLPSELITHRPDLAALEARMKAARLDVSSARRRLLPSFRIDAQSGLSAIGLNNFFDWQSLSSILSPSFNWDIFTGGAATAGFRIVKSRHKQLADTYRGTMLQALGEVEAALVDIGRHRQMLADVETQADAVASIARHDYQRLTVGLVAQPQWITSELVNREYRKALAQEQAALLVSYASLMHALGGGMLPDPAPQKP